MCDHSFLFHSLFFACLQNCFPNLRLPHWTLDPGTFQNIFVRCCDNDYSIFKTNHHITSSDSCKVDKQNTFFTRKRNINAVKEVPWGLTILLKNRVLFVFRERSSWKGQLNKRARKMATRAVTHSYYKLLIKLMDFRLRISRQSF